MWPIMNRWDTGLDAFSDLHRLHRQMSRFFDDDVRAASYPPVNVWGNADEVRVAVELPGMDPSKVELTVTGQTLTIQGERLPQEVGESDTVYRRERPVGTFSRSIRLPYEVDNGKIQARYEHGVLKVVLPRHEETKPRKIQIQS